MKAILLASGLSSRMYPLSDKNLLSLAGKPLLLNIAENAQKGGVSDFIIVASQDNHVAIKAICGAHPVLQHCVVEVQEGHGQDRGVLSGLKHLGDDEPVLVLCGNDYVAPTAYAQIIAATYKYDGALLAKTVESYFPGGYLSINDEDMIESIIEKPGEGHEPSDVINIVVHGFARSGDLRPALEKASSSHDDVYEVGLQKLFETKKFKAVRYTDYWQAVKYPWHVLDLMKLIIKDQRPSLKNKNFGEVVSGVFVHKTAKVAPSAIFQGKNIIIEAGAKVFHNAVISGPCYIGKNCIVGNNALVRGSMLEEGSSAGYNTEIARSYLGPATTTHIAYVGDSVVDSGCNFGAFSCTANLRLDHQAVKVTIKKERTNSGREKLGALVGKNAQIGIHSCLMPGVTVHPESFVAPGEVHR